MAKSNSNPDATAASNVDPATVASFGDEWATYDQSGLPEAELASAFDGYFRIFPWHLLPSNAEGFDMGCGSGRWAKLVAPRVGRLNCIDASPQALDVARRTLAGVPNVAFFDAPAGGAPLAAGSQDFGYSLGVLHHIPDTESAMQACVDLLKPGAPFLVYLYYRFDNRPAWFRMVWSASELVRAAVSRFPPAAKNITTDAVAILIYWPIARLSWLGGALGFDTRNWPLHFYRSKSLYMMRTDSRDRFGTPLEQRFTKAEIKAMMERTGLDDVVFSDTEPYWCAAGVKK